MKKILLFVVTLFAIVGCEKSSLENVVTPDGELISVTVRASMPDDSDTRVSVSQGVTDGDDWTLAWEEDDELWLFETSHVGQYLYKLAVDEIDAQTGVATFTGEIPAGEYSVYLMDQYKEAGYEIEPDYSEQAAGCSTPPMSMEDTITISADSDNSQIDIQLVHISQGMDVRVSLTNANDSSTYTLTNIAISGAYNGNDSYYNFDNVNVSVDNIALTDEVCNVYCYLPSFDVVAGGSITITATIMVDGEQKICSTTITNGTGVTLSFDAGKHNYLNATFDCGNLLSQSDVNWIDYAATTFAGGVTYDSSVTSYSIETPEQLAYLAKLTNDGEGMYGKTFTLSNNINLDGKNWTPIGSFFGTFDGGGYSVENMYIYVDELNDDSSTTELGLFSSAEFNSELKDLSVSGLITCLSVTCSSTKSCYIGGIVGYGVAFLRCKISNCSSSVVIEVNNIKESYAYIGGIAGYFSGFEVVDCHSSAAIKVNSTGKYTVDVGGIVGSAISNSILNCRNTGSLDIECPDFLVGGIAGNAPDPYIVNCYNTASINAIGAEYGYVGGIIGSTYDGADGDIANCYNSGAISGGLQTGGIAGLNATTITNCYNSASVKGDDIVGGVIGTNKMNVKNCYWNTDAFTGAGVGKTDNSDYYQETEGKSELKMKSEDFVTLLNTNAYSFNNSTDEIESGQEAYAWQYMSDSYPTLVVGVLPTSSN